MFKQEWKQLFSKPLLLGTMIVMMFIPIIYSGFFLGSSWDPYGKTDQLPVAVVNNDVPAEFEGNTLNIGEELTENLKGNGDLDWSFTDANEAKSGMDEGKYFMVLTIPEDFSKNAASVMDEHPEPMNLQYETNPGRGFFIESVSKQATTSIKEEIAENVTKEYVKAVFSQIDAIGTGMADAADGAEQLNSGTADLQNGNAELMAGLGTLSDGSLSFRQGAEQLEVGAGQFVAGAKELDKGANKLSKGVTSYTAGVGEIQDGLDGLAEGTAELDQNGPRLVQGSRQLTEGLNTLLPGAEQLRDGLSETQTGSTHLSEGLKELQTQTHQLTGNSSGMAQLVSGQAELGEGLSELSAGSSALKDGLEELNNQLPSHDQVAGLQQGLEDIRVGAAQLDEVVHGGNSGTLTQIQTDLAAAQQAVDELQLQSDQSTIAALETTSTYKSLTAEQQSELKNAVIERQTIHSAAQQKSLAAIKEKLAAVEANINNQLLPAFQSLGTLPDKISALNGAIAGVNPAAADALGAYPSIGSALTNQLIPGAESVSAGAIQAAQANDRLQTGLDKTAEKLPELTSAVDRLAQGSSALNEGVSSLAAGSDGLVEGAGSLQKGAAELENGTVRYADGVTEAAQGAGQLQQGAAELAANSADLNSGAEKLTKGASSLAEGAPALTAGAQDLAGGATELQQGSEKLETGSSELGDGIGKLKTGTADLADGLGESAQDIKGALVSDDNYDMMASPATATESRRSDVPNYGHALAPYILSLALFVGALSFNLVFPINSITGRPTSGLAWWFSKFSLGFIQATATALIVDAIMIFGFDLQVEHMWKFIGISVVTSLTYMFLIMFLSISFGNPGRFTAMIILVLQLGASGGMFPVELTNKFFQTVHDFVPMSYAILGFREAMSSAYGNETYLFSMTVLVSFLLMFNLLLWGVLSLRNRKAFRLAEEK